MKRIIPKNNEDLIRKILSGDITYNVLSGVLTHKGTKEVMPAVLDMSLIESQLFGIVKYNTAEVAMKMETAVREDNGYKVFTIKKLHLFPQIVSAAQVDTDPIDLARWHDEQMESGAIDINNMRGYIHSHVNMGVSPSHTDEEHYSDIMEDIEDYFVYMIVNKKGDLHIEITDVQAEVLYHKKDIIILSNIYGELEPKLLKQCDELVTEAVKKPYVHSKWPDSKADKNLPRTVTINGKRCLLDNGQYNEDLTMSEEEWDGYLHGGDYEPR